VEEWADDRETWGKTTAKTQGSAMRKGNKNGGAKWWLAGGEKWTTSHLTEGNEIAKRENLWSRIPLIGGERETAQNRVHTLVIASRR
jgi:hypothetical protein